MPHTNGDFDPFWSFVEEDMELLQENGLNGIRYAMNKAPYCLIKGCSITIIEFMVTVIVDTE